MTNLIEQNTPTSEQQKHSLRFYKALCGKREPYWMALEWTDEKAVHQFICSDKYDLEAKDNETGETFLMRLIRWGKYDLVKAALLSGVAVNRRDKLGQTALDHARAMYLTCPQEKKTVTEITHYLGSRDDYRAIYHLMLSVVKKQKRILDLRQTTIMMAMSLTPKKYHKKIIHSLHKPKTATHRAVEQIKSKTKFPLFYAIDSRAPIYIIKELCRDKKIMTQYNQLHYYTALSYAARYNDTQHYLKPIALASKSVLTTNENSPTAFDILKSKYQMATNALNNDKIYLTPNQTDDLKKWRHVYRENMLMLTDMAQKELESNSLCHTTAGKQAIKYQQLNRALLLQDKEKERD